MNANVTVSGVGALSVVLSAFLAGCATTPPPAAEAPTRSSTEQVAIVTPAGPPDQVEMSWQDNGVSIRPLSGPGRERSLAQPVTAGVHRGALTVAPPSNADGFGASKKKTLKK